MNIFDEREWTNETNLNIPQVHKQFYTNQPFSLKKEENSYFWPFKDCWYSYSWCCGDWGVFFFQYLTSNFNFPNFFDIPILENDKEKEGHPN